MRIRAGSHVVVADAAVVAVPASTAGAISFEPPLPDDTAAAMLGVRYGHAAKLFVRLGAPAPPSATLSVPGRFWCWTQLGADGAPAPFVGAFAGTPRALERLVGASRPDASGSRPWGRCAPTFSSTLATCSSAPGRTIPGPARAYSAESVSSPIDTEALTRPVGPLAFAGEHTAGEWHAQMEGALRSGERAAQQLLQTAGR